MNREAIRRHRYYTSPCVGRSTLALHATFSSSWAQKCTRLAQAGMLHLRAISPHLRAISSLAVHAAAEERDFPTADGRERDFPTADDRERDDRGYRCSVPRPALRECNVDLSSGRSLMTPFIEWKQLLGQLCTGECR